MSYQCKTPILFLAFNRPDCAEKVFESIRSVKPSKLYVAVDGPRPGRADDVENRDKVLEIVKNVDWDCETHYLIHERNLGCSLSGVTAWRWFFEHEERMLFIEDDGLGGDSAFWFMDEMLERYKDDERILNVGVDNFGLTLGDGTYFFTRKPATTYFMGTWKRVMDKFEYDLDSFPHVRYKWWFMKHFVSISEYLVSTANFSKYVTSVRNGNRENTYDLQLDYMAYKDNMYSVNPNVNLVSNIGYGGGANTNYSTQSAIYQEFANKQREVLLDIAHRDFWVDKDFELKYFKKKSLYGHHWFRFWLSIALPEWMKKPMRLFRNRK